MSFQNPPRPGYRISLGTSAQRGFYAVEILMGMTILVVAVTCVGVYFKYNMMTAKKSDSFFISTELASSNLEKTKRQLTNPDSLAALLLLVGTSTYTRSLSEVVQGKTYQVTLKYQKLSAASTLMKVKAIVNWDGNKTNALGMAFPFTP